MKLTPKKVAFWHVVLALVFAAAIILESTYIQSENGLYWILAVYFIPNGWLVMLGVKAEEIDISSKANYPGFALSNFAAHEFELDGIRCASMEGLLQSFKFQSKEEQLEVCTLSGKEAKVKGEERNEIWQSVQKLWWKGVEYEREGEEYQNLLDKAFAALSDNKDFQKALLATENKNLRHSIGESNPQKTCLTEKEFCTRLERIRERF